LENDIYNNIINLSTATTTTKPKPKTKKKKLLGSFTLHVSLVCIYLDIQKSLRSMLKFLSMLY